MATLFAGTYTLKYTSHHNSEYIYEEDNKYVVLNNTELFDKFHNNLTTFTIPSEIHIWDSNEYQMSIYQTNILGIKTDYQTVYKEGYEGQWDSVELPVITLTDGSNDITNNGYDDYYSRDFQPTIIKVLRDTTVNSEEFEAFIQALCQVSVLSNGAGNSLDTIDIELSSASGLTLATANTYIRNNIKIKMDEASLANLTPKNIAKGITLFGVAGVYGDPTYTLTIQFTIADDYNKVTGYTSGFYKINGVKTTFNSISMITISDLYKDDIVELFMEQADSEMSFGVLDSSYGGYDNCTVESNQSDLRYCTISTFTGNATVTYCLNGY